MELPWSFVRKKYLEYCNKTHILIQPSRNKTLLDKLKYTNMKEYKWNRLVLQGKNLKHYFAVTANSITTKGNPIPQPQNLSSFCQ